MMLRNISAMSALSIPALCILLNVWTLPHCHTAKVAVRGLGLGSGCGSLV